MRSGEIKGEIKALTGLRIVASVWVVLFHFRPMVADVSPDLRENLAPVLNCGAQGVDLFFILSGFVLTWNYLDRMGQSWSLRATLHFLWLRLARVWPVYLVTLHLAAAWFILTLHVGHTPSPDVGRLTAISYVRQVLLVQLWFQPFFDLSSWDGPAWSISAEWLAYLLFAGLVLVIFRIQHATRARGLILLAFAASLPPVLLLLSSGVFYTPWSWLPRIVTQFAAGAVACAAVRRLRPTDRGRRIAGYLSLLLVAAIVGILYLLDAFPITGVYDSAGVVDLLFVPLVITLAIGVGSLPRLLSTRLMVYAGEISFCLYMVHELVHTSWTWAVINFQLTSVGAGQPVEMEYLRSARDRRRSFDPAVPLRRRACPPLDAQDGRCPADTRGPRARGVGGHRTRRPGRHRVAADRRCAAKRFRPARCDPPLLDMS